MYKNIVDGDHEMVAGMPESFNVLVKEIRSLGINIELERSDPRGGCRRASTLSTPLDSERTMKDLLNLFKQQRPVEDFDAIKIGLASPDLIRLVVLRRSEEAGDDQLPHLQAGARRPVLRRSSGRSRTTSACAASTSA
jgi:hypothetical protein